MCNRKNELLVYRKSSAREGCRRAAARWLLLSHFKEICAGLWSAFLWRCKNSVTRKGGTHSKAWRLSRRRTVLKQFRTEAWVTESFCRDGFFPISVATDGLNGPVSCALPHRLIRPHLHGECARPAAASAEPIHTIAARRMIAGGVLKCRNGTSNR